MSINRSLGKYKMVYSFHGLLYSSENEQARATHTHIDELPKNVTLREKSKS